MSLNLRRILAATFIVFFLIIAPLLVLWSSGFRWNPKKWSWQQTGSLSVETIPSGAAISINGKILDQRTPTVINALLPDIYDIQLEKDGFSPWSERVEVIAGKTIIVRNVLLLPKNLSSENKRIVPNVLQEMFQGDTTLIVRKTETSTEVVLLDNQFREQVLHACPDQCQIQSWSPDGAYVVLRQTASSAETNPSLLLINARTKETVNLSELIPGEINFVWSDQNTLFAKENLRLVTYDPKDGILKTAIDLFSAQSYLVQKGSVYALEQDTDKALQMVRYDLKTGAREIISDVPEKTLKILELPSDRLALFETRVDQVVIAEVNEKKAVEIDTLENTHEYRWDEKKTILTVAADLELIQYDFRLSKPAKTLITRASQQFDHAFKAPDSSYFFVEQEKQIKLIEQSALGTHIISLHTLGVNENVVFWQLDKKFRLTVWTKEQDKLYRFEIALEK